MPYTYRARILEVYNGEPGLEKDLITVQSLRMRFSELDVGTVLRVRGWLCTGAERLVLDLDREETHVGLVDVSREDLLHLELR